MPTSDAAGHTPDLGANSAFELLHLRLNHAGWDAFAEKSVSLDPQLVAQVVLGTLVGKLGKTPSLPSDKATPASKRKGEDLSHGACRLANRR